MSPLQIKVSTPTQIDPAVAEVSDKPLTAKDKKLLQAPLSEQDIEDDKASHIASSKPSAKPDENSAPKPKATKGAAKAKGTPGAGKHLKRPVKVIKETAAPIPKTKSPLGSARTVATKGKFAAST